MLRGVAMTNQDQPIVAFNEWQVQSLRLTAFPVSPEPPALGQWQALTGTEPDEQKQVKGGEIQELGNIGPGRLSFAANPLLTIWRITPAEPIEELSFESLTIGSFDAILAYFVPLMEQWLQVCPPLLRLAFGAELLLFADSRADAYQKLNTFIRGDLDPENTYDYMLQINRRRESKLPIKDLRINRLTRWAVAKMGVFGITVTNQQFEAPGLNRFGCRLELDINTWPEYKSPLPQAQLSAIYGELIELGKELAERGDIP